MKKKLFIILGVFVVNISLVLSFALKKEDNKVITKEKTVEMGNLPSGIMAYTVNGEKTSLSYEYLLNNNTVNKITCKNGTVATFNTSDNSVSLSNIKMPEYCTIDFNHTFYSKLLVDNPKVETRTDFSTTFTTTNTGTLYTATESIASSTPKDVYYFAGNAQNNWVKFGGYYWRIIRTNHDGSIKLLYAGTSPDTTSGYIGTSAFNSSSNSPKYVGYMYGTDGSLSESRTNTNDSTIKTYIDNWYSTNLSSYTKYISTEAVYCNDRQLDSGQTWSASSSFNYITYTRLDYTTNGAKANPTYDCADSHDAFSASNTDAKLTYPIGLMTGDEISFAGGKAFNNAPAYYYLNSAGGSVTGSTWWWSLSPNRWGVNRAYSWDVLGSGGPGGLFNGNVNSSGGVRPVISLKGDLIWKNGDGSSTSPYEVEDLPPTLYEAILTDNPTISTRTDFSAIFTATNTGTLYKATESIAGSTAKDVYYFAGDAKNNWVKFAGFYWRIIRTNADGSIRLLYSGTTTDTTSGYIGKSAFNSKYSDAMYVGYMYGTSGSLASNRANTNNSTIKTYIDKWYSNNLTSYTKYISTEAVYCNDREVGSGTYSATGSEFYYAAYTRLVTNKTPTYDCEDSKDAFSGTNNEAKLTYPIGLMTADEITYAGGYKFTSLTSPYAWYYLNSAGGSITGSTYWWLLSPRYWNGNFAFSWNVFGSDVPGYLGYNNVDASSGVRPAISLKTCALWSSGNGSSSSPYEVNGGC